MSKVTTFMTKPNQLNIKSFYPRKYDPIYLKTENLLKNCVNLSKYITEDIKSGSTPSAEFFCASQGVPFIKTSALGRHLMNVNDLYFINREYHKQKLKRSISKPYDIIYSMTGKYMGKAAMCPKTIQEINMSQNSVKITMKSKKEAAFYELFLNSEINKEQVKGLYSITKQKYINQNKIALLKVPEYKNSYDKSIEKYIKAFDGYYESLDEINSIIKEFNNFICKKTINCKISFTVKSENIDSKILTPSYYNFLKSEVNEIKMNFFERTNIENKCFSKGIEIGSDNYEEYGIPYIKTSDIVNYDVDYQPNCYCNEDYANTIDSIVNKGDVIFTKDGKVGEVAIIGQKTRVIPSGGIVIYKPKTDEERYGLFLLLASEYGKILFKKWSVIASTMTHLRKEFFCNIKSLNAKDELVNKIIKNLKIQFEKRDSCYQIIQSISNNFCENIEL